MDYNLQAYRITYRNPKNIKPITIFLFCLGAWKSEENENPKALCVCVCLWWERERETWPESMTLRRVVAAEWARNGRETLDGGVAVGAILGGFSLKLLKAEKKMVWIHFGPILMYWAWNILDPVQEPTLWRFGYVFYFLFLIQKRVGGSDPPTTIIALIRSDMRGNMHLFDTFWIRLFDKEKY